jgi:serine/threonine-protein kinase SRPK3
MTTIADKQSSDTSP